MNKGQKMMAFGIFGLLLVIGISTMSEGNESLIDSKGIPVDIDQRLDSSGEDVKDNAASEESQELPSEDDSWQTTTITDVRTGEDYKISDFSSEVVLIETFAVWCPKCKSQQDNLKELIEGGDTSIHISLNVDPNEDSSKVLDHVTSNGYDWKYSIFPASATQGLVDEFGPGIVSAPSVPMILICPGDEPRKLGSGIKSVDELKTEIATCN